MKRSIAAALVLLAGSSTAAAEIYRWVDDQGRVHYGDRPRGANTETVELPSDKPSPAPTNGDSHPPAETRLQRWLKAKQEERADRNRAAHQAQQQQRQRLGDCKRARSTWDYYRRGGVFYDDRPDGTRHFLSDADMAAELARVKRAVKRYCGQDPAAGERPPEER